MKNLKVKVLGAAVAVMVMAFAGSASAESVNTSEFGKFTYTLTKSGSSVTANTSIAKYKSSTKVITALEVQDNATGKTIGKVTRTETGKSSSSISVTNLTAKKLAAFSAHEARGNGSVAKYLAKTF
ncbi:hypothetical protein [Paenibacillus aceti]|uniref:Uncharacterized protein n=1 Tax=Paenibacillus aceti TaxID=1820010 RepID=A0ABQ1VVB9_9BACL|nr:hypothetical protein [Paenibacillus aceti]GGF98553.1 hypothetical protein GCM10010913_20490 [Paenibacillus aceti]